MSLIFRYVKHVLWLVIFLNSVKIFPFYYFLIGYGKSLCYQYPPVYLDSTAICISPLISLMEDQVLKLHTSNIPACFLGSGQKNKQETYSKMMRYVACYTVSKYLEFSFCIPVFFTDTMA